jgi:UDP-2,4-diacetamido-2,4,6-trideoxy-beta-L-altropyranose hydrolase
MKNNKVMVAFRADGSAEIGMGHIMRCLALAQGMENAGARASFVVRSYTHKVAKIVQRYGFTVKTIPKDCSWSEDLRLTLENSNKYRSKLIITDLGNAGNMARPDECRQYLQGLRDSGKYLVAIDDLVKMSLPADIIVNPHYGVEKGGYYDGHSARLLLGPDYFIFRPEFIAAARLNRKIKAEARDVLVTMSGSDPLNFSHKVIGALVESERTRGLNLRIVLGMDYTASKKRELGEILTNYPGRYELIQDSDNMAELMRWSDIAVTGGGLTKYELAVTGTPGIIIPQYDYLVGLAREFAKTKAVLDLGFINGITGEAIAGAVAALLGDFARRAEMSRRGRALVDGRGIERIISEIPAEVWS